MKEKGYVVAVAGAMGAVGREMILALEQRNFPVSRLKPLGSLGKDGRQILFRGEKIPVGENRPEAYEGVDIALFATSGEISLAMAPEAVKRGCIVIDNSCAWRMDPNTPLVVPEVNPEALRGHRGIIANPNCTTIIAMVPIKPLHDFAGVRRIIGSTYQAASGAGSAGLAELRGQTQQVLNGEPVSPKAFAHQLAFNVIPQIDIFCDNGYTREEMKMLGEGRKILGLPDLRVNCTCVRVPVFRSHSESLTIETERPISPEEARALLAKAPGVRVVDDPAAGRYPMPLDTSYQDLVWVGRIRRDISGGDCGLTFWCCGDQLRKGAAVNAVQIAEKMREMQLI